MKTRQTSLFLLKMHKNQKIDKVKEASHLFNIYFYFKSDMIEEIKNDTVRLLYNARIYTGEAQEREHEKQYKDVTTSGPSDATTSKKEPVKVGSKVGRNDPCPCGSGKKYKKCCGANL